MSKSIFMLCETIDKQTYEMMKAHLSEYVAEQKEDGERIIAIKRGDNVQLLNRRGANKDFVYPEITEAIKQLAVNTLILDGEVVTQSGLFKDLQSRALVRTPELINERRVSMPVIFKVFDILAYEQDITLKTLLERKEYLAKLNLSGTLQACEYVSGELSDQLWNRIVSENREGIVLKRKTSIYVAKRSKVWLKLKNFRELVIQFDKYERNNAGVKLSNGFDEVQVQGLERADWIINKIAAEGKVEVNVQYLEHDPVSKKMRFPSCKEVVGYD